MSSRLIVNSIRHTGASSDAITLDSAGKCSFPNGGAGKILQVVQAVKTDTASFNSTNFADISGLSASITPHFTTSKILVDCRLYVSLGNASGSTTVKVNFVRGSTNIGQPTVGSGHKNTLYNWNAGTYMQPISMNFLDSPSTTSATTYKLQVCGDNTSATIYFNRYYGSDNYHGISTLTLMEAGA